MRIDTFSITMTVPDDVDDVDEVDVYVDGLKDDVPTLPVATDLSNTVNLTPTASPTAVGTPGAAAQLTFTSQPTGVVAKSASVGTLTVAIEDASNHTVTTAMNNVTLSLTGGTAGATLACTNVGNLTVAAVNGVATFTGCNVNRGGVSYHLQATAGGLSADFSSGFNVQAGAVTQLVFSSGWFTACPVPSRRSRSLRRTLTARTCGMTRRRSCAVHLHGHGVAYVQFGPSVMPSNGIATFTGCSFSKVGGFTLRASDASPWLTQSSGAFNEFAVLVFTTSPSAAAGSGVDFVCQPVFTLRNGDGTTVSGDSSTQITLSLTVVSGGPGACSPAPRTRLLRRPVS